MDPLTSPDAGPFDVRAALTKIIGSRTEGVSHQELIRKMRELTERESTFYYEPILIMLIGEGKVTVSHCGIANHKTRVYLLSNKDEYKKTCRTCGLTKIAGAFRRRIDSKDSYNSQCKLCENRQRKANGWANKSRKRRQEELRNEKDKSGYVPPAPQVIPEKEEIDASAALIKAESLKDYQEKLPGKAQYILVDGKVVSAPRYTISPVEEYDRAWRRIKTWMKRTNTTTPETAEMSDDRSQKNPQGPKELSPGVPL